MIIKFKKPKPFKLSTLFFESPKIVYPAILLLILASYFFLDKPFAIFFTSLPSEVRDILGLFNTLLTPFFTLLLFPFLFFFVRFIQRKERKSRKLWYITYATALSIFLGSILQVIVGRSCPGWFFAHGEMTFRLFQWNPEFHSFPSITSCNIGALTTAFGCLYPKHSTKLFFVGMVAGTIPAVLSFCFIGDAFAGICIGMIVAVAVFKAMRREMSFS